MARGPVVVDTDVFSARLIANSLLGRRYEPLLAGRGELISFQTAAELRYGALLKGWGPTRLAALERAIDGVEVVHSDDELIATYATSEWHARKPDTLSISASTMPIVG